MTIFVLTSRKQKFVKVRSSTAYNSAFLLPSDQQLYMSEGLNLVQVVFKFRGNQLKPCRVISSENVIQNGGRYCS